MDQPALASPDGALSLAAGSRFVLPLRGPRFNHRGPDGMPQESAAPQDRSFTRGSRSGAACRNRSAPARPEAPYPPGPVRPLSLATNLDNPSNFDEPREVMSPTHWTNGANEADEELVRARSFTMAQGPGFVMRQATDVIMEERTSQALGELLAHPPAADDLRADVSAIATELVRVTNVMGAAVSQLAEGVRDRDRQLVQDLQAWSQGLEGQVTAATNQDLRPRVREALASPDMSNPLEAQIKGFIEREVIEKMDRYVAESGISEAAKNAMNEKFARFSDEIVKRVADKLRVTEQNARSMEQKMQMEIARLRSAPTNAASQPSSSSPSSTDLEQVRDRLNSVEEHMLKQDKQVGDRLNSVEEHLLKQDMTHKLPSYADLAKVENTCSRK